MLLPTYLTSYQLHVGTGTCEYRQNMPYIIIMETWITHWIMAQMWAGGVSSHLQAPQLPSNHFVTTRS